MAAAAAAAEEEAIGPFSEKLRVDVGDSRSPPRLTAESAVLFRGPPQTFNTSRHRGGGGGASLVASVEVDPGAG